MAELSERASERAMDLMVSVEVFIGSSF